MALKDFVNVGSTCMIWLQSEKLTIDNSPTTPMCLVGDLHQNAKHSDAHSKQAPACGTSSAVSCESSIPSRSFHGSARLS